MAYESHFVEGLDKMSKTIQDHKLVTQECERESFVLSRVKNKMRWNGCAPHEIPLQTGWAGTISMDECLPESPKKSSYDKLIIKAQGKFCLAS